jgi:hypothetical protein
MGYRDCRQIPVMYLLVKISVVAAWSDLKAEVVVACDNVYLCDCVIHNLLVRHIALVAYEQLVDTLCSISVDLLKPLLNVVE